ncbi:MAG TPA: polyprenyl diphosphate synthase [Caulobacteraceae bacterium]|nr:polyprenyl diphosphate synthase [Caulobacteraceae bacterium]
MSRLTGSDERSPKSLGDGGSAKLHVAIIMDGNGRWATRRGLPRAFGHRAGVAALRRTVEAAPSLGVDRLTVFGFSTENWRRPPPEISELMSLMKAYFHSDLARLEREGVKVRILGRRSGLDPEIRKIVEDAEARTAHNDRFALQVAFNYGGRADIVDAARAFARDLSEGTVRLADLDESSFEAYLSTAPANAPDLIIRTSGERRLSNFLLWECAYSELVFQDVLWPDYGLEAFKAAVDEFHARERRFGAAVVDAVLAAS